MVTLRGTLAIDGAVVKVTAASPHLMVHEDVAHVVDSLEEVDSLNDEIVAVTADHVLVMRNVGPVGAGMPEAGSIRIPKYLADGAYATWSGSPTDA